MIRTEPSDRANDRRYTLGSLQPFDALVGVWHIHLLVRPWVQFLSTVRFHSDGLHRLLQRETSIDRGMDLAIERLEIADEIIE
jgi:hypothetical protein